MSFCTTVVYSDFPRAKSTDCQCIGYSTVHRIGHIDPCTRVLHVYCTVCSSGTVIVVRVQYSTVQFKIVKNTVAPGVHGCSERDTSTLLLYSTHST